jgi:hypothetical protein
MRPHSLNIFQNLRKNKHSDCPREQTEIFDPLLAMALYSLSASAVHNIYMYVSFVSPLNSASFFIKAPAALQE